MTMGPGSSRREFLRNSVLAAATVTTMNPITQAEPPGPTSRSAYTVACRDVHLRQAGSPGTWAAMKAVGVEGIEVLVEPDGRCPYLFGGRAPYTIADGGGISRLRDELKSEGVAITAFCLMNRLDERPDEEASWVARTARAAAELGVPAIRLDFVPRAIKDTEEFLRFSIRMGRRIVEATGGLDVRFGVENHGTTTNRPEFSRRLFEGVGSPRFGLTLDTANFYWFGHPLSRLYEIYEEFAKLACHTHCKSIRFPPSEREKQRPMGWEYDRYCCPLHEGDIDFRRVVQILRKGGYSGDLCIEDESLDRYPKDQVRSVLQREAAHLREVSRT